MLSDEISAGDAIIAATAAKNNMALVSSNTKYFKPIKKLKLNVFKP
jgi:predicted nucleic acid-binding protein